MTELFFQTDQTTIYNADCLDVLSETETDSVNLIFVDWPYYKVKNEPWDRQWDKPNLFLQWIDQTLEQSQRVLAPNGSLYGCASPQMAYQVEGLIRQRFNVLNSIRWYKEDGWHKKADKESLRQYLSPWEAIVFAGQLYRGGNRLLDDSPNELRDYLNYERERAGLTIRDIAEAWRIKTKNTNITGMAGHWFGKSQWGFPVKENYLWLRKILNESDDHNGHINYLRREYEDLRRPFNSSTQNPHTDLWTFKPVKDYPGKHPTEKPVAMLEHIIRTSSRPGDLVLDFCMGTGTTLVAARNLGRKTIGVDLSEAYCKQALCRLQQNSLLSLDVTESMQTKETNNHNGTVKIDAEQLGLWGN